MIRVVASVAAGALFAAGAAAHVHHTIPQVRAAVSHLTAEEDQAVQEYDLAAQNLHDARVRVRVLDGEVRIDQAALSALRVQIAQMAAAAYEGQSLGSAGAMLNTGDSQAVMNQAALIGQLSITQATEVRQFTAAALRLREARTIALRAESGVALLDRQLLARKRSVMRSLHRQRALLSSLTARQREAAAQSMPGLNASLSGTYTGPTNTQAGQAVAYAYSKLGDPYVWGATGPSTFDCSGLAMAAWASAGVTIPRTTFEQVAALPAVPLSALRPGDLLFFLGDDHVGMYVGGGYLIDAPHTGAYVEKVPFTGWYRSTFVSAARP